MRFATPARHEWEGWGESTVAIVAMGLALAIAGLVRTLETPASQSVVAFELFVSLLVPTGLATGGIWLARRNVSPDVRWRVATRVSIGIVVACALSGWLVGYVALNGGTIRDPLSLVTILAAVGGMTGFTTAVREPWTVTSVAYDGDCESDSETEPASATVTQQAADSSATSCATETTETATASPSMLAPTSDASPSVTADSATPAATIAATAVSRDADAIVSTPSMAETALQVLGSERSRVTLHVLYHECDVEGLSVDDLARAVAAHTDESADAVAVSLRHATLPELASICAVDWDPYRDRVSASEHAVFEEGVREASVVLESFEPGTR